MLAVRALQDCYASARVVRNGQYLTTVNNFTDQTDGLSPDTLLLIADSLGRRVPASANKIVGEEEKGAHLATAVSLVTGLPLVLARAYPYLVDTVHEHARSTRVTHEYFDGLLTINGLRRGDRIVIVDDTLSTGGTLSGLLDIANGIGAFVESVLIAVHKVNYAGLERIRAKSKCYIGTLCQIRVADDSVSFLGPGSLVTDQPIEAAFGDAGNGEEEVLNKSE